MNNIKEQIERLKSEIDYNEKLKIIAELKKTNEPSIIPDLIQFFSDSDIQIRNAAFEAVNHIITTKFLEAYSKSDSYYKDNMLKVLNKLDDSFGLTIREYLTSDDPQKRMTAIELLEKIGNYEQLAVFLYQAIKDKNEKVRATVARAISSTGNIDVLKNMLEDPDPRVRANALQSLDKIGGRELTPLFLQYRMDPNNRIRAVAIKALWNRGYRDIEGLIMNMAEDKKENMRASAAWLIGEIGNKNFFKILSQLAKDPHPHVRINVISALLKLGGPLTKEKIAEIVK